MNAPVARLSPTLSRVLLRLGQTPARRHHGALALWLICLGTLSVMLWIGPTQGRIQALEATLHTHTIELRERDERLREAKALNHALNNALPATTPTTTPAHIVTPAKSGAQDPWPFLQSLAHARSVHLLDYTPATDNPKPDCQRLRLKMSGAPLAVQGLLNDLLHSPQSVERFTLSPSQPADDHGATALSLQVCMRETTPSALPGTHSNPSAALFQPRPKVSHTPRTALEEHPLAAYRVIATGRAAHDHYALVRTPAGKVHTVRPGVRIGDQGGQVSAILPNGIEIQHNADRQSLLIGTPP